MTFFKHLFSKELNKRKDESDEDDYSDSDMSDDDIINNNLKKEINNKQNKETSQIEKDKSSKIKIDITNEVKQSHIEEKMSNVGGKISNTAKKNSNNVQKISKIEENSTFNRGNSNMNGEIVKKQRKSHMKTESFGGGSFDKLAKTSVILSNPKIISWQNRDAYVYTVESKFGKALEDDSDLEFVIYIPIDTAVHWLEDISQEDESEEDENDGSRDEHKKKGRPGKKKKRRTVHKVLKTIVTEEESTISLGPLRPREERGPIKIVKAS